MARNVVSRVWDESKVNRDEEGKFAPKDTRGGGKDIALDRHSDGDLDVYVTDNKKLGFRYLGDDGTPVDVEFNPKSFAKIQRAIDILIEGYDDEDSPGSGVTQVDVQTNLGKVRLELFGEWEGNGPGNYLTITPVGSDAWGIVVAEVGENQEFYDRGAGYR